MLSSWLASLLQDSDRMSRETEFNVRKRMLPVALLFKTRARDADKLKSNLFGSPSEVLSVLPCLIARFQLERLLTLNDVWHAISATDTKAFANLL